MLQKLWAVSEGPRVRKPTAGEHEILVDTQKYLLIIVSLNTKWKMKAIKAFLNFIYFLINILLSILFYFIFLLVN